MENINIRFSKKLKELRNNKKLTQEALSELAGIDYKYLQKLESNNPSSPTLQMLEKIANALDINIIELLSDIDKE